MSEHVGDTVTTDGPELFFNPLQPGYVEDPWPHFAELRAHDPVHLTLMNQWLLFTYEDVSRLLRDPSLSVSDANIEIMDEKRQAIFLEASGGELQQSTSMLNADPPDHTRLRRLVSKAFTPAAIEALRPRCNNSSTASSTRWRSGAAVTSSPSSRSRCRST